MRYRKDIRVIQLTQVVSDVKPRRARLANVSKIVLAFLEFTRVNHFACSQNKELVEEGDDIASRLMDRENDGSVVVASK
jgi:hypothetical protein